MKTYKILVIMRLRYLGSDSCALTSQLIETQIADEAEQMYRNLLTHSESADSSIREVIALNFNVP
jgi:hypothetical protein